MRGVYIWLALALLAACADSERRPTYFPALAFEGADGDAAATVRGRSVVRYAQAQVGRRYCWGGTGPACFDCSGLVQRAWRSVGVRLPRTADDIASMLVEVPLDDARPGDVLWWPGHVGIYAGGGWMIDAYDHRHGVVRRRVTHPQGAFRPQVELAIGDDR